MTDWMMLQGRFQVRQRRSHHDKGSRNKGWGDRPRRVRRGKNQERRELAELVKEARTDAQG